MGSQRVGHDWATKHSTVLKCKHRISSLVKEVYQLLLASLIAQLTKNPPAMQETPGFDSWVGKIPGEGIGYPPRYSWASLVAQLVKKLPAMQETWVQSLGWEDPLEKGKATHSSILAWRIPWTIQSMGSQRVRHDWVIFTFPQCTGIHVPVFSLSPLTLYGLQAVSHESNTSTSVKKKKPLSMYKMLEEDKLYKIPPSSFRSKQSRQQLSIEKNEMRTTCCFHAAVRAGLLGA